jgi:hypothetical protein
MENSSRLVFSVVKNLESLCKRVSKKKVDYDIKNLFKSFSNVGYSKVKESNKTFCARIYSDIENNYYSYKDLIIYCVYKSIFGETFGLYNINRKSIHNVKKLFSKKRLKEDKEFIKKVNEKLKIKKLKEYFDINLDGENIAYSLVKDKVISPIFYLQYYKKYLTNLSENHIFKDDNFCRFERLINLIFKTFKMEV